MKGWRSVFFSPSLQSMTTLVRKALPTTPPRLYSATQMWIFRNSFSLNQEQPSTSTPPPLLPPTQKKKKSGMGMDSSNVDKRTRLIPCRCACELREGALRCPRSREKGTSPWRKLQWITRGKQQRGPVQLVLTVCCRGRRSETTQERIVSTHWRNHRHAKYMSSPMQKSTIPVVLF